MANLLQQRRALKGKGIISSAMAVRPSLFTRMGYTDIFRPFRHTRQLKEPSIENGALQD